MNKKLLTYLLIVSLILVVFGTSALAKETLRFWHTFTQPVRIDYMKEVAKDFEKEYDVDVQIEIVPWAKVEQKWIAAKAAGILPDVIVGTPNDAMAVWLAGASNPLNDVFEELGGDKFFTLGVVGKFSNYKGNLISLPLYAHTRLLLYRADIFKELGLESPETWDELLEVTAKANNPPTRYGAMQFWSLADRGATLYLYPLLRTNGASFFDKDFNVNFNTPEFIETVKFLVDWYKVGAPQGELNLSFHEKWFSSFTAGLNTMGIDTMFIANTLKTENPELYKKGALGVCRPPVNDGKGRAYFADAPSLIDTKGPNEKLAKEFIKYMYETNRYVGFLLTIPGGQYPVTIAASNSERFWSDPLIKENEEGVKMTLEGIANGTPEGMTYGINPFSPLIDKGVIERMMQNIVGKGMPVEEAVAQAQTELEKDVKELRERLEN